MLNQASRYVYDSLDSMNKFQPKIKLNSKNRLKDTIDRYNANLQKLATISINNVSLTAEEIEALKIPALSNTTTESFASESFQCGKVKGLALEITK